MEKQQTRAVLYTAFLKTIQKVGVRRFKQTTLFGSNEIKEESEKSEAA